MCQDGNDYAGHRNRADMQRPEMQTFQGHVKMLSCHMRRRAYIHSDIYIFF